MTVFREIHPMLECAKFTVIVNSGTEPIFKLLDKKTL